MEAGSQPLVSIVTPVYNGEEFLVECIESVLAQSYQNWEHVIVNNCSTDRSLEIAQSYAQQDKRIRVHTNAEFVGVVQNHNIAFRLVSPSSKYCKVVQADNWVFPECVMEMVKVAEANPTVGIVGAYRLDGEHVLPYGLPSPRGSSGLGVVVDGRELCRSILLGGPEVFGSPSCHLIRADLLRGREAFYNVANLHADTEACFEVLQACDFGFVHQILVYERRRPAEVSSFARRFNTYLLSNLIIRVKYGSGYLSREEHTQCLTTHLAEYYSYLARSVFQRRESAFWEYHRHGLEAIGHPLDPILLAKSAFSKVVGLFLKPRRTFSLMADEWTRAKQQWSAGREAL